MQSVNHTRHSRRSQLYDIICHVPDFPTPSWPRRAMWNSRLSLPRRLGWFVISCFLEPILIGLESDVHTAPPGTQAEQRVMNIQSTRHNCRRRSLVSCVLSWSYHFGSYRLEFGIWHPKRHQAIFYARITHLGVYINPAILVIYAHWCVWATGTKLEHPTHNAGMCDPFSPNNKTCSLQ